MILVRSVYKTLEPSWTQWDETKYTVDEVIEKCRGRVAENHRDMEILIVDEQRRVMIRGLIETVEVTEDAPDPRETKD